MVSGLTDTMASQRILLVDDEEAMLNVLEKILRAAGFTHVRALSDSRRVLAQIQEYEPDILVLDLQMPHLDGFSVLRQIRHRTKPSEYFPVLVVSGDLSRESKQRALQEGAKDFVAKPYDAIEVVLRVKNLLETRELTRRLNERLEESTGEVRSIQVALADRLAMAAELRDRGRGLHTTRVGRTARMIAAELSLPDEEVELISRAAPLHDIGMIGVPDAIVLKPGDLTLEEWDVLKRHTILGASILAGSDSRVLQLGEEIALYHHENWDGTGYTPGLGGDEIPLAARVASLADVFDSLIHDRPYCKGWPLKDAVDWIVEQKGRKFDPQVVDAFLRSDPQTPLPGLEEMPGLTEAFAEYEAIFPEGMPFDGSEGRA